MRFILPVILILIAIGLFFVFTNPIFNEIRVLQAEAYSYDEALGNSKMLENERDKLAAKYNSISTENLSKLKKFLPENVDNIRLILEIEQIAAPYGMTLKDVKYNTGGEEAQTNTRAVFPGAGSQENKEYGVFDLEFSTSGSYGNFINFTRDLESNLRIVDISSIVFSSDVMTVAGGKSVPSDNYTYNFKIKTYWLKD
jgi:Tfp pilus assembly protein PilO